jgi:hypothetical protein
MPAPLPSYPPEVYGGLLRSAQADGYMGSNRNNNCVNKRSERHIASY